MAFARQSCRRTPNWTTKRWPGSLAIERPNWFVRGGVTALAGKRDYPVFVDETAELFNVISVSAGVRGTQILLAP